MLGRRPAAVALCLFAAPTLAADVTTIFFSTGTTITLPPGAQSVPRQQPTPAGLHSAQLYRLGETMLVVTEPKLDQQSCSARFAAEWAQMQKNLTIDDPDFKALMHIKKVERQSIDGVPALYSEIDSRSPQEAAAGKPYHAGSGYLLCTHATVISLTLAALKGSFDAGAARSTLLSMLKSLRAKR